MDHHRLATERARAGAELLDDRLPGWAQQLRMPLSLASTRTCVLAQLFGRFRLGTEKLVLSDAESLALGFRGCSSELGNDLRAFAPYYQALTEAWKLEVRKRLV